MPKKVGDVIGFLKRSFPEFLQEEWDNSGGFKLFSDDVLKGIVLSLDPVLPAAEFAIKKGANLIITHHPFSLSPLRSLDLPYPKGRFLEVLFENRISLYSMHTNFDWAEGGMNDLFAKAVGARSVSWIDPIFVDGYKLVTFFPEDFDVKVFLEAMDERGLGGRIGNYSMCSFRCSGTGTFVPLEGARPVLGEKGCFNEVSEFRLEIRVERDHLGEVVGFLKEAHPYEEPPIELYPVKLPAPGGRGRVCVFDEPMSFDSFMERISQAVSLYSFREPKVFGSPSPRVSRFGLCMGKGMSLYMSAVSCGVDLFVTGDVGYHDLELIDGAGVPVVDVGHEAEMVGLSLLGDSLSAFSEVFTFFPSFEGEGV